MTNIVGIIGVIGLIVSLYFIYSEVKKHENSNKIMRTVGFGMVFLAAAVGAFIQ